MVLFVNTMRTWNEKEQGNTLMHTYTHTHKLFIIMIAIFDQPTHFVLSPKTPPLALQIQLMYFFFFFFWFRVNMEFWFEYDSKGPFSTARVFGTSGTLLWFVFFETTTQAVEDTSRAKTKAKECRTKQPKTIKYIKTSKEEVKTGWQGGTRVGACKECSRGVEPKGASQMAGKKKKALTQKQRNWVSYGRMDGKKGLIFLCCGQLGVSRRLKLSNTGNSDNDTIRKQGHLCSRGPNPQAHPSPSSLISTLCLFSV